MSAILIDFICSLMMFITGLFVMKKITSNKENIFTLKNTMFLICLVLVPANTYSQEYNYIYTITFYIIMIITYKYILNISFQKSLIGCGILMLSVMTLEILSSCILVQFVSANAIRNTWYIKLIANILYTIALIFTFYKTKLGDKIEKLIDNIEKHKYISIILFIILTVIATTIILFSMSNSFKFNFLFTKNLLVFIIFFLLIIILFTERDSYDKLSNEYDNLFDYIKIFEEWIEKEQFIRHEYKNQLAVIRCMTKDKAIKDKIDSIIAQNINIDNEMTDELKYIPNGGLKGLIYYKVAAAKTKKINIEIDVSSKVNRLFKKLSKNDIEILTKVMGVYCDNAIEAALDTERKIFSIEIYEENKQIIIVICNTFNKDKLIENRNIKGVSTKGQGRGNGLYFAKKLLLKNKWIEESQEIKRDFYIEKIKIKK